MKTVVLERDVHELEIKPHALLSEYRALVERDVRERFAVDERLEPCSCPGCRSARTRRAFEKLGFQYVECADCGTLYVSPRPSDEALVAFYRDSTSSRFWRDRIGIETRDSRREKVFRPRSRWVLDVIDRHRPDGTRVIVAGYHGELLVSELSRQATRPLRFIATNPVADIELGGLGLPNVEIRPTHPAELDRVGPADLFLAFDLIDRTADVDRLFSAARAALPFGGLFVGSTTLITGFDLQVLWDRSETIQPPERLNLLSAEGLQALVERHGFEALEFSTPGVFDVEIVQRTLAADPNVDVSRFIKYVLQHRDETALNALQEYLQQNRLSSFARIALRKVA